MITTARHARENACAANCDGLENVFDMIEMESRKGSYRLRGLSLMITKQKVETLRDLEFTIVGEDVPEQDMFCISEISWANSGK